METDEYITRNRNLMAICVLQAFEGLITEDFRLLWVDVVKKQTQVHIILREGTSQALENIEDSAANFEGLHEGPVDFDYFVEKSSKDVLDFPRILEKWGGCPIVLFREWVAD